VCNDTQAKEKEGISDELWISCTAISGRLCLVFSECGFLPGKQSFKVPSDEVWRFVAELLDSHRF